MSIRRLNIYLPYILLLWAVCTLVSCRRKADPVPVPDSGCPIELSAGFEWPDATRSGVIESVNDLSNDGFVVWARWTKDDATGANADKSNYSGDYASGVNPKVFGEGGTKAYSPDWSYSPQRFWHRGSYLFAAALPASSFNASHARKNDASVSNGISGVMGSDGKLTLTDIDLKNNPADLMVAFANVDNSSDSQTDADRVSLMFEHQLAMVNFKAKFDPNNESDITINKVILYGNSRTASAEFTFDDRGTATMLDDRIVSEWTPGTATTSSDIYSQVTGSWATSGVNVIENLHVFPEECSLTVAVDYTESYAGASASARQSAQINVDWKTGKIYTYEFSLSAKNIIFSAPVVTEWTTGGKADEIPSM